MSILAICPRTNSKGKRDVTGAFLPECIYFSELHSAFWASFDNTAPKRACRREVEEFIQTGVRDVELLALFMHGFKRGIQSGHNTWNVKHLARAIGTVAENDIKIALFACDTGRDSDDQRKDDTRPGPGGEGGFADKLRDSLVDLGLSGGWVDAHSVKAHTTRAPYVRRFYIDADSVNDGGEWLISPGSPEWKAWRNELRSSRSFRLSFPLMTKTQIYMHLAAL